MGMNFFMFLGVLVVFVSWEKVGCFEGLNATEVYDEQKNGWSNKPLLVALNLISGAAAQGAVCLDGSLPGYHLHRGFGSGRNRWLVQLEGGGWCDTIRNCVYRKKTRHGSSNFMEKFIPFVGILSNKQSENPDFYNWNRVKILYCDGGSFSGDSQDEVCPSPTIVLMNSN